MILCRGAAFYSSATLNPDEAELLAAGRRAALDVAPYVTYTTPTYLLVWPIFLGTLASLGVPMVLQTAHLLSGLAYFWTLLIGWYVMSRAVGWRMSALFVVPGSVALFVGPGPVQADFLSLGTELLAVSILMVAGLVMLGGDRAPTTRQFALASAIAGLAIWAKPQVALLALTLVAIGMLLRQLPVLAREAPLPRTGTASRDAIVAFCFLAAPAAVFLAWMLFEGTLSAFASEPIAFTLSYLTAREALGVGQQLSGLERVLNIAYFLFSQPLAFALALPGVAALSTVWGLVSSRTRIACLAIFAMPLASAVATLALANPIYPHNVNFLYLGCLLSGMGACTAARFIPAHHRLQESTAPAVGSPMFRALMKSLTVLAILLMLAYVPGAVQNVRAMRLGFLATTPTRAEPSAIIRSCPAKERVYVWGWAPELYAEFDWTPASRYVVSAWQILDSGHQGLYKDRLVQELKLDPPACIVEAVGSAFFDGDAHLSKSLSAEIPELGSYLASCFEPQAVTLSRGRYVQVWVRVNACSPA
jgi:hypothetical protein